MRNYELRSPFLEPSSRSEEVVSDSFAGPRRILTVTELSRQIQALLEESFPYGVWVEGELSDPKIYPSGHLWFDLKDSQSTLKCVMWRDDARRLKFQPEQGLQVITFGKVDFYAPRGEVKFVARSLEPKGLGALQLAFEQLKGRLQKEGLFAEERKRPLPLFPERVGIVTSPRGAAIDDILKLLRGHLQVLLYPSRVQGESAAEAIVHGIEALNAMAGGMDLLIVGRGGGSLEDLWAFNEESVARAIASSRLPIISAVGHEKDVTISDLVADLRAPTPTKAAELVLAQRRVFLDRLEAILENPTFVEPEEWLNEFQEKVGRFEADLVETLKEPVLTAAHNLRLLYEELLGCSPQALILHQAQRLHALGQTLTTGVVHSLEQLTAQVHGLAGRLNALSPLAVLERGYSITFDAEGRILKSAASVKRGDLVQTHLSRGRLVSRIEETKGAWPLVKGPGPL